MDAGIWRKVSLFSKEIINNSYLPPSLLSDAWLAGGSRKNTRAGYLGASIECGSRDVCGHTPKALEKCWGALLDVEEPSSLMFRSQL